MAAEIDETCTIHHRYPATCRCLLCTYCYFMSGSAWCSLASLPLSTRHASSTRQEKGNVVARMKHLSYHGAISDPAARENCTHGCSMCMSLKMLAAMRPESPPPSLHPIGANTRYTPGPKSCPARTIVTPYRRSPVVSYPRVQALIPLVYFFLEWQR